MIKRWADFKRFWMAEEVPRWFGLSLVAICLFGFGFISYCGITQAQLKAANNLEWTLHYAGDSLKGQLEDAIASSESDQNKLRTLRQALRTFAAAIPTTTARVLNHERRVIASADASEDGTVIADGLGGATPAGLELVQIEGGFGQIAGMAIRAPLGNADPGTNDSAYLEIVLDEQLTSAGALGSHTTVFVAALTAFVALFVVYRGLRGQMRGMTLIRRQLQSRAIESDLLSLHISDCEDAVTSAWNELVATAHSLSESVQHANANDELSRVLERSGGGALSEALNAVPDGVLYITDEVRIEYINSAACRLYGWKSNEVKGLLLPEAQSQGIGEQFLEVLREALTTAGVYEPVSRLIEDSANESSYRISVTPLNRAAKEGECIVFIRDVSQQIRAEKARDDFVTQVTHELRTPLTNIRAYAETLSSGLFDDPSVITECYNVIMKETRRLARLIEDILSASQLEVGSIELTKEPVDLRTLLSEGVRDVRGLADDKKIEVELALPSKLEPVQADRDKLAVVVNNLLGNAIKYTPEGGNVVIGCQTSSESIAITVKDNGIGIDPSEHSLIFDKFKRGTCPDAQAETGTGIGLYTAREIVRRHGGDIQLISKPGEGSTFMVTLPHQESRATALSAQTEV